MFPAARLIDAIEYAAVFICLLIHLLHVVAIVATTKWVPVGETLNAWFVSAVLGPDVAGACWSKQFVAWTVSLALQGNSFTRYGKRAVICAHLKRL